jgi:hypothetical protein
MKRDADAWRDDSLASVGSVVACVAEQVVVCGYFRARRVDGVSVGPAVCLALRRSAVLRWAIIAEA